MASKRQMVARVKELEDALAFEKAKLNSAVKIVRRLSTTDFGDETYCRFHSYWMGYWQGQQSQGQPHIFERDI